MQKNTWYTLYQSLVLASQSKCTELHFLEIKVKFMVLIGWIKTSIQVPIICDLFRVLNKGLFFFDFREQNQELKIIIRREKFIKNVVFFSICAYIYIQSVSQQKFIFCNNVTKLHVCYLDYNVACMHVFLHRKKWTHTLNSIRNKYFWKTTNNGDEALFLIGYLLLLFSLTTNWIYHVIYLGLYALQAFIVIWSFCMFTFVIHSG